MFTKSSSFHLRAINVTEGSGQCSRRALSLHLRAVNVTEGSGQCSRRALSLHLRALNVTEGSRYGQEDWTKIRFTHLRVALVIPDER